MNFFYVIKSLDFSCLKAYIYRKQTLKLHWVVNFDWTNRKADCIPFEMGNQHSLGFLRLAPAFRPATDWVHCHLLRTFEGPSRRPNYVDSSIFPRFPRFCLGGEQNPFAKSLLVFLLSYWNLADNWKTEWM